MRFVFVKGSVGVSGLCRRGLCLYRFFLSFFSFFLVMKLAGGRRAS